MRQVLYRATRLDLRTDPWKVLGDEFGLDRGDYGPGELDHEIFWSLARVFSAAGYVWVEFLSGRAADFEEWMHLGSDPLAVDRVAAELPGE